MTGQAAARGLVPVERVAHPETNAIARDNRGALGPAASVGAVRIETATPVGDVARAIREAGFAIRVSVDAGDYVCNHLYYRAL